MTHESIDKPIGPSFDNAPAWLFSNSGMLPKVHKGRQEEASNTSDLTQKDYVKTLNF